MTSTKNRRRSGKPAADGTAGSGQVSVSSGCDKCKAPSCLALVRADTSPESWKDLLDRQLKLISSGHWGAAQVGYLGAIIAVVVVVTSMVGWLALTVGPVWTGLAGSGAVLTSVGVRVIRRRRQNAAGMQESGASELAPS